VTKFKERMLAEGKPPREYEAVMVKLAASLGLMEETPQGYLEHKAWFWSSCLVGDMLDGIIQALLKAEVLEQGDPADCDTICWRVQ